MTPKTRKRVIVAIPTALVVLLTFVGLQDSGHERGTILLLILATILLTCSSVGGFWFLMLYGGTAVSFGISLKGRTLALILAAVAFGISFGSGALLSWLPGRV
jgi:hypothetical protein